MIYHNRTLTGFSACFILFVSLASCTSTGSRDSAPNVKSIDLEKIPNAVPQYEPLSRYGNPGKYEVRGKTYWVKKSSEGFVQRGKASWYGTKFHGRRTSSGVPYDMYKMTAAHKTLPLPSYVEVKNLDNGKKIIVKVNDRGPFHAGRIIDLSYVAALKLDIVKSGTGNVEIRTITPGQTSAAQGKPVYVQVGAYREKENAQRMKTRLAQADIDSDIHKIIINARKHIYRVRIGPLEEQNDVGKLLSDLEDIGVEDAKVLSENGE